MNLRKATDSGRQDEMDVFEELPYEFVLFFHLTLDDVFTPYGARALCSAQAPCDANTHLLVPIGTFWC